MANRYLIRGICASLVALVVALLVQAPISASHNWGGGTNGYHWQRSTNTIRYIPIRRLHSSAWLTRYAAAYARWRSTAMTKVRLIQGATGGPSNTCPAALNQITSCDGSYGSTGWLGLATIWTYSGTARHIAQGTSKVNNTYFNTSAYNTVPWRQFVICQEIGHNFGLGHVNEVFNNANTGSCMDYTNDPDGGAGGASASDPSNMNPNAHDYTLINSKHNHVGSAADMPGLLPGFAQEAEVMPAAAMAFNPMKLSELGTLVHVAAGGRLERYERDFGGVTATSFVIRAK